MKYIQGFYCQYLSVVGNWDHWWTYDGISGPGISFKRICYWTNQIPHFCSSHISEHLKCDFICSILGSDQPSLDDVQQRAKAVPGQHWPSCINIWPKPHSHPGIIRSKNFRLEHSWMLEEHQPSSTHFWSKFTTIQVLIIVQSKYNHKGQYGVTEKEPIWLFFFMSR